MILVDAWRHAYRLHRIKVLKKRLIRMSNKRDVLKKKISADKQELLSMEDEPVLDGQIVWPQGFEVER